MSETPTSSDSHRGYGSRHRSSKSRHNGASETLHTGLFLVLLLMLFALFAQTVQDTVRLDGERESLNIQLAAQRDTLNEARNVRAQLEAIAGDTAILAEAGNQNAIQLRDFLAEKGVTIRPPAR